jgi:hypothetical protein
MHVGCPAPIIQRYQYLRRIKLISLTVHCLYAPTLYFIPVNFIFYPLVHCFTLPLISSILALLFFFLFKMKLSEYLLIVKRTLFKLSEAGYLT